jgi:hypothetical protein
MPEGILKELGKEDKSLNRLHPGAIGPEGNTGLKVDPPVDCERIVWAITVLAVESEATAVSTRDTCRSCVQTQFHHEFIDTITNKSPDG